MSTRRTAAGLAGLATTALVLAGCGGGDDDSATPDPTPSATSTPTAPSSSPSPTAAETREGDPSPAPEATGGTPVDAQQVAAAVDAALDDTRGAQITLDSGLALLTGEGTADFRQEPTAVAVALTSIETGDAQQVDIRVVDGVLYVADATRWLRLELDSPANPFGSALADQLDPRRVLDAVVENYDSGTRDGSTYVVEADGPAVAAALAPDLAGQEDADVPPVVTAQLVVDDDGLATDVVVDLGAENGQLTYTLGGWSTGDDTAVTAPPPGQVDELPDLSQ